VATPVQAYLYDCHGVVVDSERQMATQYYEAISIISTGTVSTEWMPIGDYVKSHPIGLARQAVCQSLVDRFDLREKASTYAADNKLISSEGPSEARAAWTNLLENYEPIGRWEIWKSVAYAREWIRCRRPITPPIFADCLAHIMWARKLGIRIGLVTFSEFVVIEDLLIRLGIRDHFDTVVARDSLTPPATAKRTLWLEASQRLGVSPSNCFVIEDSNHGATEASLAGFSHVSILSRNSDECDATAGTLSTFNHLIDNGYLKTY
jgi:beta-phosphoglucomutase-like phosphatase (HAD superfamily)